MAVRGKFDVELAIGLIDPVHVDGHNRVGIVCANEHGGRVMSWKPKALPGAAWRQNREPLEGTETWWQQTMVGLSAKLAAVARMPPKPNKGRNSRNEDYCGDSK